MRRALLISLLFGCLCALASVVVADGPAEPEMPSLVDPMPYEHELHQAEIKRLGLGCVSCHKFGGPIEDELAPSPDLAVCHGCHRNAVPGVSNAPSECATCHPVRDELLPPSHSPDWLTAHAVPARSPRARCGDCHERSICVDCHASRGALARNPHPPTFRSVHGVEARLDPASCDGCHMGDSCTTCHLEGGVPW